MEYGLGSLREFLQFVRKFKICYPEFLKELAKDLKSQKRILHEKNICHRDLKPDNIIIRSGMKYLFTDYGLAGIFKNMTQYMGICGTLAYLPENIQEAKKAKIDFCEMNPFENDEYALKKINYEAEEATQGAKMEDKSLLIIALQNGTNQTI